MMEQFQFGNKICQVIFFITVEVTILINIYPDRVLYSLWLVQEIEMNKASWSALFEPFQFFEAYKNYLQVDIIAEDDEDLRLWKGWVESRLRQLTLKVAMHSCFFYLFNN